MARDEARRACAEETDDAWIAVVQLRHRVEEMRDQTRAPTNCTRRYVRGGDGVTDAHDNTSVRQRGDGIHDAVDLGRERHHAYTDAFEASAGPDVPVFLCEQVL